MTGEGELARLGMTMDIARRPRQSDLSAMPDTSLGAMPDTSARGRVMKDYRINIFWSDEDGSYVADIPDLTYCSAFGETPREALETLEEAGAAWLESARAEGKPIPTASYRPVIYEAAH